MKPKGYLVFLWQAVLGCAWFARFWNVCFSGGLGTRWARYPLSWCLPYGERAPTNAGPHATRIVCFSCSFVSRLHDACRYFSCTGFTIISTTYVSNKPKPPCSFSWTCSYFFGFKWISEMQVVEMIVRPPYELCVSLLSLAHCVHAGFLCLATWLQITSTKALAQQSPAGQQKRGNGF